MGQLHSLTRSNVDQTAPRSTGVYKLYKSNGGPIRYVGSTNNLRRRLKKWASDDSYSYFEYEFADTREQAYKREANLYHHHGKSQLDNDQHPKRPNQRVKCPACSIHD